ncbi:HNH/ENDO VII family nuclease [Mycolicibacterium wolinskyi]|uniref:HNH/ENDO VII family nuclease n=1 Tax=Mycolicibacterium wolinskyi TaxID=59750 RepID=UPI003BAA7F66
MAAPGTGAAVPTRSQVQDWDTKDLDAAATRWRAAAATGETAFESHRQNILHPGGTTWAGDAKDAALDRVTADLAVARHHGDVQREGAEIAAQGAQDIAGARSRVLDAIAEAEADGFTVGEDLSVTDTRAYDVETAAARATAAAEHAEYIRWRAEQLAATDALVGQRLQDKAAELEGIRFEGEASADGRDPTIQLVDNKTEAAGPDSDEPGKTWQDMLLPPESITEEVGDTGTEPATAADEAKSPLDELLVPEKTTDPDQPENLNEALDEVAGQPVPAATGPRLDPAKVEEFKATARKLMQQDGVPADQIEQRLNDMVTNAQKPLVPYSPPEAPPLDRPTFGEGVGNRLREIEDSVDNLAGQNGWDTFKESWENVGTGLAETALDPYGTAARTAVEEAEMARRYPEYWLGGKAVDVGATAATLPFGAEGAAAARLGALDDVARSGIPHEVIDVPRTAHNPTPIFDQSTPALHPGSLDNPVATGSGGDHSSPPTGHLPLQGEPGSFGYDASGDRLPYANSRPDFAPGQVASVWDLSRDEQLFDIRDSRVGLPEPGPNQQWVRLHPDGPIGEDWIIEDGHRLIEWQPGDPRKGLWDMGHVEGGEYRFLREDYLSGVTTYEEFLETFRDPAQYRVQDPFRNRSHIDEGP